MLGVTYIYIILAKNDKLWRNDKTKEKGFGFLGVVNGVNVNISWKLMKVKDYLVRFVQTHLYADFLFFFFLIFLKRIFVRTYFGQN